MFYKKLIHAVYMHKFLTLHISFQVLALWHKNPGPDLQIKAWVGHCVACGVETGLATQHWSCKSEDCA